MFTVHGRRLIGTTSRAKPSLSYSFFLSEGVSLTPQDENALSLLAANIEGLRTLAGGGGGGRGAAGPKKTAGGWSPPASDRAQTAENPGVLTSSRSNLSGTCGLLPANLPKQRRGPARAGGMSDLRDNSADGAVPGGRTKSACWVPRAGSVTAPPAHRAAGQDSLPSGAWQPMRTPLHPICPFINDPERCQREKTDRWQGWRRIPPPAPAWGPGYPPPGRPGTMPRSRWPRGPGPSRASGGGGPGPRSRRPCTVSGCQRISLRAT